MASYTTSLRLVQPATGEYSGSWGTQVNNGLTALVDTSVAGTATITMTAADYTLSTANGATDEARAMVLNLTGTPGAARNVICPAVSKVYIVYNNTTGGFAQTLKTSAGTGISVPNGKTAFLRCDGTNVVEAVNYAASLSIAGTANGVMYLNGSNVVTTGSGLVFDGTNLGIGTGSPTTKLDISSNSTTTLRVNRLGVADVYLTAGANGIYGLDTASTNLHFGVSNSLKMTLDSSGNLGIGTSSPAQKLDVSGAQNSVQARFGNVAGRGLEISTALISGTNDAGSVLNAKGATSGTLIFQTDSTERMRLDASGNLAVGTTSTSNGKFTVAGVTGSANNTATFSNGTDTQSIDILCGRALTDGTPAGVASSLVMTLRSSGSSPGVLAFATGNNERARITGGDLLVGTTTTPSSSNAGFVLAKDGDGTYLRNACTITSTRTHFEFVNGNGTVGSISTNGSATAFNTSSDRRLKENIQPAANAAPVIDAIEIVQHDWKAGGHTRFGVIAQDLHAVAPEAVTPGDDGDEIEKTWGVDYSKLVPMLIKEIQSLRARVAALEAA